MVELHVAADRLTIQVLGLHQLWAFKRRIDVPLASVRAVRRLPADGIRGVWKGWRVPGTHLPGIIVAGTYYKNGERQFWDVRHADHAIELELDGQPYQRVFVEVDDPERVLRELEPAAPIS